jgi:hypothetical protein
MTTVPSDFLNNERTVILTILPWAAMPGITDVVVAAVAIARCDGGFVECMKG